ncbi:MAG: FHA domain-containing protein [Chloroflexi bacterium]|nr:FHA domain-containing protein [Chloroflexota bacterium]
MIECPVCGRRFRPGTLFCSECGIYLSSESPLPTEPIPEEELAALHIDPESLTDGIAEPLEAAATLYITVVRSKRQVLFPLPIDEICLGRRDVSRGVFPDLDLGPDGGLAEGVSRNHARIYQRDKRLFVEDIGSVNGTYLNNRRIIPHLPYPLQQGNTLQLGTLRMLIEFG